jgi:hypothetical protein
VALGVAISLIASRDKTFPAIEIAATRFLSILPAFLMMRGFSDSVAPRRASGHSQIVAQRSAQERQGCLAPFELLRGCPIR